MTEVAIRVSNLSKCYLIYDKPQDRLKRYLYPRLQRLAGRAPRQYFREFWALKDVSFEVEKGKTAPGCSALLAHHIMLWFFKTSLYKIL